MTFHTFRHTFGTLLNANEENAKVVQEFLRHASLKVTTDVYMQAVSHQKREAQGRFASHESETPSKRPEFPVQSPAGSLLTYGHR